MKYIVLFAVLAVIYLLWKHQRQQERAERDGRRPQAGAHREAQAPAASPQEMVRCAACDLHLPRADAVADAQGRLFCGTAHRDKTHT